MKTHVCDYCGSGYSLESDDDMILCRSCGEMRLYNLVEKRVSSHYSFPGQVQQEIPVEEEEEIVPKRSKKKSKDIKMKKGPTYAEKFKQQYGYKTYRGV